MADHSDDGLIREVNEDLREEQMKNLWKAYGGYVVAIAVLIVAVVAGYQGWKHYDVSTRSEEGNRFYAAQMMMLQGDTNGAKAAFGALADDASSGYGTLARFEEAALLAKQGDKATAAQIYQNIARDNAGNVALSGLANIMGLMLEIDQGGYDAKAIEFRLSTLADDSHPYRFSARELLALIALQAGDTEKARTTFEQLANDRLAPQALRQRAQNMVLKLGS